MSIVVISTLTWLLIIVFAVAPKRFTIIELIFQYFVSVILTVTIFSILDIKFHWVIATREVERGIALNISRFMEIPMLMIITTNIMYAPIRVRFRCVIAVVASFLLTINDWILTSLHIIHYTNWKYYYAFIMYMLFMVAFMWITIWFSRLRRGGIENI
ncbi:hypothetical protein [Bacillus sp. FJAT-49736]|uniref:hypothetical protein n=1 Tax=Bacillus sp. FJAT-49736 TaxID=2833582 RepID=UPI001BC9E5BF|nr:hypothetical protein [Bacillus sp. FJAT-49736]MBS4172248.1 hypothetical protein [Bacillus sp. FJAT-49736]